MAEEEVYLLIYIDGGGVCLCTKKRILMIYTRNYKRRWLRRVKKYVSSPVYVSPNLSIYNFDNDNYRIFALDK